MVKVQNTSENDTPDEQETLLPRKVYFITDGGPHYYTKREDVQAELLRAYIAGLQADASPHALVKPAFSEFNFGSLWYKTEYVDGSTHSQCVLILTPPNAPDDWEATVE